MTDANAAQHPETPSDPERETHQSEPSPGSGFGAGVDRTLPPLAIPDDPSRESAPGRAGHVSVDPSIASLERRLAELERRLATSEGQRATSEDQRAAGETRAEPSPITESRPIELPASFPASTPVAADLAARVSSEAIVVPLVSPIAAAVHAASLEPLHGAAPAGRSPSSEPMSMHAVGSVPPTARSVRARTYDGPPPAETIAPPPPPLDNAPPVENVPPHEPAATSASAPPGDGASVPPLAAAPLPTGWRRRRQYIWAILCHLFLLLLIPTFFLGLSLTFLVWQLKGRTDRLVEDQGREALNFQINVAFLTALLGFTCIGAPLVPLIWIVAAIFAILAARAVSDGRTYRYPFVLRIVAH